MFRRDYDAIAAAIHRSNAEADGDLFDRTPVQNSNRKLAERIADHCEKENPRFQRERFMLACGFAPNGVTA